MPNNELPNLEDLLADDTIHESNTSNKEKNTEDKDNAFKISGKTLGKGNSNTKSSGNISLDALLGDSTENKSSLVQIKNGDKTLENNEEKSDNIFHKSFKNNVTDDKKLFSDIENSKKGLHLDDNSQNKDDEKEDPLITLKKKEEASFQRKIKQTQRFFLLAQSSIVFGVVLFIVSFLIFSFLLDTPEKGLLGGFIKNNYGTELSEKKSKVQIMKTESRSLKKQIKDAEKTISEFKNNTLLESIVKNRIHWLDIINQINIVRCQANPIDISECTKNIEEGKAINNPFTFENYTTKGEMIDGKIEVIITGKASDSQGYIFQKISRLIQTFNDSKHFSGAEMRQYSKTEDSKTGFYMPFSMNIIFHSNGKILEDETTDSTKKTSK